MNWTVRYRASVEKDLARLPGDIRTTLLAALKGLQDGPFPSGYKKLRGSNNRFRLRVAGDYRIVYSVLKQEATILVEFVGHRKDAYRWF